MLSLRSTAKSLDPTSQVISMRHLAQKASLQPPISLRRLNDIKPPIFSVLTGYAVPIKKKINLGLLGTIEIDTGLDHTYVKSDNPYHVWPCWGGSSGGKPICGGYGSFSLANFIAYHIPPQLGDGTAGIIYGVTGVCHQTANRILYPAGVTVEAARGYKLSHFAYGTYGLDSSRFFELLQNPPVFKFSEISSEAVDSVNNVLLSGPAIMDMQAQSNSIDEPKEAYIQEVVALYMEQMQTSPSLNAKIMNEESSPLQERGFESFSSRIMSEERYSLLGKELKLGMRFRLGGNPDPQITEPILKQQSDFLKEKGKMDSEFYSANLNIEEYVKEVNNLFGNVLISLSEILGKEESEKLFDLSSLKEGFVLIDPDMAVKAHEKISIESINPSM